MLIQFSVENFLSFKEKAILSLEPSSDKELTTNISYDGNNSGLNSVVIYGANAAGKTNIFKALASSINIIRDSEKTMLDEEIKLIVPFAFDPESVNMASSFEYVFIYNGIKYVYGFSATRKHVEKEYLYVYKTAKATTIFERDINKECEYRFTVPEIEREMKPIIERTLDNKLFLSVSSGFKCKESILPMRWFMNCIDVYDEKRNNTLIPISAEKYENDSDGSLRSFTKKLLMQADINIDDYLFEMNDVKEDSELFKIMNSLNPEKGSRAKEFSVATLHRVGNEKQKKEYYLDLHNESDGTIQMFFISPLLKHTLENGSVLCIDEIDRSLHPLLVEFLFSIFNNPSINKNGAQLIASTHTTFIMNLDLLRRDQFYFVEKDKELATSELFSLDEFSPRKNENIRRAYLLGRYGAIPFINEYGMEV